MNTAKKVALVVVALAVVAGVAVLSLRQPESDAARLPDTARGPSFEVRVEKPRVARPLFGILPTAIEEKLEPGGELRIDHTSPGAEVVGVGPHRLALRADDWDLLIETDDEGRIAPTTRLVYPTVLGERQVTLRCRPADEATGYLRTTARPGSDALDGTFNVQLATCVNVESGKTTNWPPAPLTLRGSFTALHPVVAPPTPAR